MIKDMETNQYATGTTSLTLIRVGELVEILFSNKSKAKLFYKELAEKFKQTDSNNQCYSTLKLNT
jgi:hypothetical protein